MYFKVNQMQRQVEIEPDRLGKDVWEDVQKELKMMVEGEFSHEFGMIVKVITIHPNSEPAAVKDHSGRCEFTVKFDALVYKLFENEVLLGTVTAVDSQSIIVEAGPIRHAQITAERLPDGYEAAEDAGEEVFQRRVYVDDGDDEDDMPEMDEFSSEDVIRVGSKVRFKVVSVDVDPQHAMRAWVIGDMSDNRSLGVILDNIQ